MKSISLLIAVSALSLAGCASLTGGAKAPTEPSQATAAPSAHAVIATPTDPKMLEVQESHRKMLATTTPDERAAMMKQQKLVMQGEKPMMAQPPELDANTVNQQMQAMQQMHRKMQAANTPKEHAALKDEHMKVMQGCMTMMGRMKASIPMQNGTGALPGGMMHAQHNAMLRRLDMLELMMQMMMDQQAHHPAPRKHK